GDDSTSGSCGTCSARSRRPGPRWATRTGARSTSCARSHCSTISWTRTGASSPRVSGRCTWTTSWSTRGPRTSRRPTAPTSARAVGPRRTPTTDRDLGSYRSEFPVLERKAYLISASLGPVSDRSRRYLDGYLEAWATKGAPDHVWFEDIFPRMRALKATFARLAGCEPDELAITTNISIAMSTFASALEFGDRNKVVMSELDFPADGHVWLAHARRGVQIEWLRSPDGLTIPLEEYDRAIDERTAVVMVNRVLYRSSAIVDAKEVCRIARERGALSFLDDYHGIGIVPLDLHDVGCDAYAAGVLKWLCGGPGLAFLYVRRALIPSLEPMVTGWFGTNEPFSFDTKHLEYHPTA